MSKKDGNSFLDVTEDKVNHPHHYEGSTSLECIDCMKLAFGDEAMWYFCLCNAFKYLWRYKNKNGKEDVSKARWYLDYVESDIEADYGEEYVPDEVRNMYERLNDLYCKIGDKIANNGGDVNA